MNIFFTFVLFTFSIAAAAAHSANPQLSTSVPNSQNIVVHHSTTTQQPLVVLLQKKKDSLTSLPPPHPPSIYPYHRPKDNYIPPFSFSSIFHPHQFPTKNKAIAPSFGSLVGPPQPPPSFESLLKKEDLNPNSSLQNISQDEWNQVPEVSTKRSDEIFDTAQLQTTHTSVAPQDSNSNDGFRLSVLVPCDDPDTGQKKKCLLVRKT